MRSTFSLSLEILTKFPEVRLFILVFSAILLCVTQAHATHNRAGHISYVHIEGNTYEFTVQTCTKSSAPADRQFLPIDWGDGTPLDSLERDNIDPFPGLDSQVNTYTKRHTFPGPGFYSICVADPNRNAGIQNINGTSSVLIAFAIQTTLLISSAIEPNNSVQLLNFCLQDACIWQPWTYNPIAQDPDNDSLAFKLVPSMGLECEPFELGFYEFPNEIPADATPVNPSMELDIFENGTVVWEVPQKFGEYNLAILVEEWRNGILVGTVLRDMQINVLNCGNNTPPEIEAIADTCVDAGSTLNFTVRADDPEMDNVTLEGLGGAFSVSESPADLDQNGLFPPVEGFFSWQTVCSHVQLAPYQTVFVATDNGTGADLVDVETMNITVVAPPPENLSADPQGSVVSLTWDESPCPQAIGYKLYRRVDSFDFDPGPCETGLPESAGYELLATIQGLDNTSFIDESEGIFGRLSCYRVVACFEDGAESYTSDEACAEIRFEIPIIKKNSIGITDVFGVDTVEWRSPIKLDLDAFPGPYRYRLLRGEGFGEPQEEVFNSAEFVDFDDLPLEFVSNVETLNTRDTSHTYRVELYSNGDLAARSNRAPSIFLQLTPNDNQIEISWEENFPWDNFEYQLYRQEEGQADFELLATIEDPNFVDEMLTNGRDYCYYVVSRGSYFVDQENDTLINFSQQVCASPFDRTPPCPPELEGDGDCVDFFIDYWKIPNETCPETDDVTQYNIYYAPFEGQELTLLTTLSGAFNTQLEEFLENSIAGCYAVTALDSLNPYPNGELIQNESELSNIVCFDNCPIYELQNVFTPNGDGINDVFIPFPYRSVESVEFTVFNRWGNIVYESTDPDLFWNGTNAETGEIVTDGTYFYVCRVFSIRLSGLEPVNLSGYITVFAGDSAPTD